MNKISEKKQKYCKKHKLKDIPKSVALASYFDVSYVSHGLAQLDVMREKLATAKEELITAGMFNLDFAIAEKAIADQEKSLHGMLVAHRDMSKIMKEAGYRPIIPELDWIDDNGEPLGFAGR